MRYYPGDVRPSLLGPRESQTRIDAYTCLHMLPMLKRHRADIVVVHGPQHGAIDAHDRATQRIWTHHPTV